MNRTLKRLGLVVVTLTSATVLSGIPPTTDIPLPGTKMKLTDTSGSPGRRNYVALRDGDPSVSLPDPRVTGATAFIGRVGAGEVTVLDLPPSGWSGGTSARQDYKFRSRSGTVVSARLVAGHSIRLSARGDGAYPLDGTPQGGVGIIIDVGGVRFCGFDGGTIVKDDAEPFRARKAPAPAGCPILGKTTTTSTTSSTTTSTSTTTTTTTIGTTVTIDFFDAQLASFCSPNVVIDLHAGARGGTGPYLFTFSEGGTPLEPPVSGSPDGTLSFFGPAPGPHTYTVTATDTQNNTSASASASVTVPEPLMVEIGQQDLGTGFVAITVIASGGVPPYSGTGTFTVLRPEQGSEGFTYTVTDADGCTASASTTVEANSP